MTFAIRLRELRTKNHLTQGELAKKVGVSMQSVSLWERGPRTPDLEKLEKLTDIFQVNMGYLLGSSDDPTPKAEPTDDDLERAALEEDDQELMTMASRMSQLSQEMRSMVKAIIMEGYRIDRARNQLRPVSDHKVLIRSKALLKGNDEGDSEEDLLF